MKYIYAIALTVDLSELSTYLCRCRDMFELI